MKLNTELIPINQKELQKIEQQQNKEQIKKLAKETYELQMIMNDLNDLLINQNEVINDTNEVIEDTNKTLENTNIELEQAKQNQQKMGVLKMSCLFALGGLIIGGPLGVVGGYYAGITATGGLLGSLTGAGFGGGAAYSVIKNKQKKQKQKEILAKQKIKKMQ